MGRVIVVTSGKGGVGKTTIAANIGIMIASSGRSVCVIDADIGLNNLDVVLGVENKIVYDLIDCIEGKCRPMQAVLEDSFLQGLNIMPACKIYNSNHFSKGKFIEVINAVKNSYDFLIIDCPAGIGDGFDMAIAPADEAVVVLNPQISSIRDAYKVIGILEEQQKNNISVVVNRINSGLVRKKKMLSVEDVEGLVGKKVIGVIPESTELGMFNSFLTKVGPFKDLKVQYAFANFCKNLIYNRDDRYDYLKKDGKFYSMMRRSRI